jgi:hypothetical protein
MSNSKGTQATPLFDQNLPFFLRSSSVLSRSIGASFRGSEVNFFKLCPEFSISPILQHERPQKDSLQRQHILNLLVCQIPKYTPYMTIYMEILLLQVLHIHTCYIHHVYICTMHGSGQPYM